MPDRKQTIEFDFNTKFIQPDTRVWVAFPGNRYKFFDHFNNQGVIFGDFPGLLIDKFDLSDDTSLKKWLALSDKVRNYYIDRKAEENYPSLDPNDYSGYSWTGKRLNSKGVALGLYSRAQKGDLVIVTTKGQAWGQTIVGELQDGPEDIVFTTYEQYTRNDQRERIPARRIKWLGSVANHTLPEEVVRHLVSPNAFSLLGKQYEDLFFAAAYENYFKVNNSTSLFDVKSERFSTIPDMYLKIIANFAAEVSRGFETDRLEDVLSKSLEEWLLDLADDDYTADQKISINSPGTNLLKCLRMTPILAAMLFAVMQYPAAELQASNLEFVNSAAGGELDKCDIPVAEASKLVAQTMALDKLEKLCRVAVKAKQLGQVQTPITSKVKRREK